MLGDNRRAFFLISKECEEFRSWLRDGNKAPCGRKLNKLKQIINIILVDNVLILNKFGKFPCPAGRLLCGENIISKEFMEFYKCTIHNA